MDRLKDGQDFDPQHWRILGYWTMGVANSQRSELYRNIPVMFRRQEFYRENENYRIKPLNRGWNYEIEYFKFNFHDSIT